MLININVNNILPKRFEYQARKYVLNWVHQSPHSISSRLNLTPQAQLSLQGTFGVWTDTKVLWTKADDGEAGM